MCCKKPNRRSNILIGNRLNTLHLMSKYGPRFDKALDIAINTNRGLRKALTVVFAILTAACLEITFVPSLASGTRFSFKPSHEYGALLLPQFCGSLYRHG